MTTPTSDASSSPSHSSHGSLDDETSLPTTEAHPRPQSRNHSHSNDSGNKWFILFVSVALGLVSGTLYGFGRYSRDLRDTMGLTQWQVQRFGILMDTGNYIGHPITGYIYDRMGPRISCLAAGLVMFTSYAFLRLGLESPDDLWIMNLGFFGVGLGSGLGYIAGLGCTTDAFVSSPHYLGRAIGFVAAGYGLSSTLVGITYHYVRMGFFFFWLWAILAALVNGVGAVVFPRKREDVIRIGEENDETSSLSSENQELVDQDLQETLLPATAEIRVPSSKWTSWRRSDFWLLLGSFACITGCGLFVINNISTMVQSIGEEDRYAGVLVFMLSICNVIGRIVVGSLSDQASNNKVDLLRYGSLLMAAALLISVVSDGSAVCLALTVAIVAMAYGGSWVLIVGILTESYGKANFGKDYGLMAMGPAVSGMIFNAGSAFLYQQYANEDTGVCMGPSCYRGSFVVTCISALLGFIALSRFSSDRSG